MTRNARIVVVGSYNTDVILSVAHLPARGETCLGLGREEAPGGKGSNQAVQAAKCGAAVPMFEGMLAESDATVRQNACWSLGEIGRSASLPKLGIVAESDAAYEVVELNKVYFVRDACRAAAGKIRLRNAGAGGRMAAR